VNEPVDTGELTEENHFRIQPPDNLTVGGIGHPVHWGKANYRPLDFRPAHEIIMDE
jgi:hypothetical protein